MKGVFLTYVDKNEENAEARDGGDGIAFALHPRHGSHPICGQRYLYESFG